MVCTFIGDTPLPLCLLTSIHRIADKTNSRKHRASGVGNSRKLNIYYYSWSKALHMGSLTSSVPGLRRTSCRYSEFSETQRA